MASKNEHDKLLALADKKCREFIKKLNQWDDYRTAVQEAASSNPPGPPPPPPKG